MTDALAFLTDLLADLPAALADAATGVSVGAGVPGVVAVAVVVVYGVALGLVSLLGVQAGLLALAARRHRAPDLTALDDADLPRVTVQVPLFDEPAVAARIVRACLALDYPAHLLDVQVLDDSRDATPALVAAELAEHAARVAARIAADSTGDGATADGPHVAHIRRSGRAGFKAGALAHGLATARGEVVAIFDADFVPAPDTLRRLVPILVRDPGVGCVQARWGHLNADASWLTRAQAMGLDLHFAIEHRGRSALGGFFNFNGTAGLWRRACIDDAGGWRADSLAEDLDLSYRAQLAGWRFVCADAVAVPAELPATLAAWRTQQRRWAKGGAEVLRLLGPRMARAPLPVRVRALGLAHIGASLALLATATVVLLHAPAWLLGVPAPLVHAGTVGALGYLAAVTATAARRRATNGGFARAIAHAPLFLAAMAGLAPSLAASVVAGLRGRATPFERTEKVGDELGTTDDGRRTTGEALAAMDDGRRTTGDAIPSPVSAPARFPAPGRLGATGDGSAAEAVSMEETTGDGPAGARSPLRSDKRPTTNDPRPTFPWPVARDAALALYLAAGWGALVHAHVYNALLFQTLALAGVLGLALHGAADARRARAPAAAPPRALAPAAPRRTLTAPVVAAPGTPAPHARPPVFALASPAAPRAAPHAAPSSGPPHPAARPPSASPALPLRPECSTSTTP